MSKVLQMQKSRNFMANCPLKKNSFDRINMRSRLDEADASESEEESSDEEALMSLMAFEENQSEDNDFIEVSYSNPSYDELLEAFEQLHYVMKKLRKNNRILRNEYVLLPKDTEELKNVNDVLKRNVKTRYL